MMLSTTPSLPDCRNMSSVSAMSCTGRLDGKSVYSKPGLLKNRPLLKRAVIQLEEDSTDIGSAMSSDADMPYSSGLSSPSGTDGEVSLHWDGNNDSCLMKKRQRHQSTHAAPFKLSTRPRNFKSSVLEPILGTPAGMSEHPPLLFTTPTVVDGSLATACARPSRLQPDPSKPAGFHAPPGLLSPQRNRKPKGQSVLSTSPKMPSPRQSRKSKSLAERSVLATAPENLLTTPHVLPPSPSRRMRSVILEKAKLEEAPLKVQMESEIYAQVLKTHLDPTEPAKKRLNSEQSFQALEPFPVKKRVTPWLLEEPMRAFPAMPR